MSSKRQFVIVLFADCYVGNPDSGNSYIITNNVDNALQSDDVGVANDRALAFIEKFPAAKPVVMALVTTQRVVSL